MDKHTPTPWSVDREAGTDTGVMLEAHGTYIGEISSDAGLEEAEANASLIVRAVNAHEELLKAMRKAIKRLRDGDGSDSFFPEQDHEAIEIMEQAIAKAESR